MNRLKVLFLAFLGSGGVLGIWQGVGHHPAAATLSLIGLVGLCCALPFRDVQPHLRNGVLGAATSWGFGVTTALFYIVQHPADLFFNIGAGLLGISALGMLVFTFVALTNWSVRGLKFTPEV